MKLVLITEGNGLVDESAEASVRHVLLKHTWDFEVAVGAGVKTCLERDVWAKFRCGDVQHFYF